MSPRMIPNFINSRKWARDQNSESMG
jgi:hypothetical protein